MFRSRRRPRRHLRAPCVPRLRNGGTVWWVPHVHKPLFLLFSIRSLYILAYILGWKSFRRRGRWCVWRLFWLPLFLGACLHCCILGGKRLAFSLGWALGHLGTCAMIFFIFIFIFLLPLYKEKKQDTGENGDCLYMDGFREKKIERGSISRYWNLARVISAFGKGVGQLESRTGYSWAESIACDMRYIYAIID